MNKFNYGEYVLIASNEVPLYISIITGPKCDNKWPVLSPDFTKTILFEEIDILKMREPDMTLDKINHPVHYNSSPAHCECGRRIECIDITRHMNFNLGNSLKYIWRSEHKNGAEDIKKAIWYLNDYLQKLSPELVDNPVNN